MNNPRFNIGDEVVALNSETRTNAPYRKKGEIYKVLNIKYCIHCGFQFINHITHGTNYRIGSCRRCSGINELNGIQWSTSIDFALLQNMTAQIEEALYEPITVTNE